MAQKGTSGKGRAQKCGKGGGSNAYGGTNKKRIVCPQRSHRGSNQGDNTGSPVGARGESIMDITQLSMFGDEQSSNQTKFKELGATPKTNLTKPNTNSGLAPLGPGHVPHTPIVHTRMGKMNPFVVKQTQSNQD